MSTEQITLNDNEYSDDNIYSLDDVKNQKEFRLILWILIGGLSLTFLLLFIHVIYLLIKVRNLSNNNNTNNNNNIDVIDSRESNDSVDTKAINISNIDTHNYTETCQEREYSLTPYSPTPTQNINYNPNNNIPLCIINFNKTAI